MREVVLVNKLEAFNFFPQLLPAWPVAHKSNVLLIQASKELQSYKIRLKVAMDIFIGV